MWWTWLVVAVLAAIGEIVTFDLFLASVAAAAVITAVIAIVLQVVILQVAVFAGLSLVGIGFVRPAIKHALGIESASHLTGAVPQSHLAGRRGVVTRAIDAAGGQIRIGVGEFWSARAYDPSDTIPVGTPVEVVLVDGLTALVERVEQSALPADTDVLSQKGS
jgi:membrane protein implicated in regulation of membrane protease activity